MYVYLIKCSIYFKIGFSKNPKNRIKTIKTHNPLDVSLFATLKTDNYLEVEKNLHSLFASKNSNGEWFELNEDDLFILKVTYGFNFHIPINSVKNNEISNNHVLSEIKSLRIDNTKIDYFKTYIEDLYSVNIVETKFLRKLCLKYETKHIKEAIDSLFAQDKDVYDMINMINNVVSNIFEAENNPSNYFTKVFKAILYNHYKCILNPMEVDYIRDSYFYNDVNEAIKLMNTYKFSLNKREFIDYVEHNFINK